jgi:SAM-dependent methyltransferase
MKKLPLIRLLPIFSLVFFLGSHAGQSLGSEKLMDGKMEVDLNIQEKQKIEEGLREKYRKVAVSPEGQFRYPIGRAGLEALKYDPEILRNLPEAVSATYCGVGNPFSLGTISQGETVLDVGCGAGIDAIFAAKMVGSTGAVSGIDLVPEMLARARENARLANVSNITFIESSAEKLAFPDKSFDVVISNGVFNLVVDKQKALKEVFRVLKPGGRLMLADQVLVGKVPQNTESRVASWFR